jgi:hypothetical protein
MSRVTFPCSEFNDSETETNGSRHRGFAEEVDFSPIEFETINVPIGNNYAGPKFMHSSGVMIIKNKRRLQPLHAFSGGSGK